MGDDFQTLVLIVVGLFIVISFVFGSAREDKYHDELDPETLFLF